MQTRAFLFSEKGRKHMFDKIKADIKSVRERDPAVKSDLEVFFLYPSFKAVRAYRRAHKWYLKKHYFIARWISQRALRKTGIEIHPGATIGKGCVQLIKIRDTMLGKIVDRRRYGFQFFGCVLLLPTL